MQSEMLIIIKAVGSEDELNRMRQFVDTNEVGFDFDKVLPPPDILMDMDIDRKLTLKEEITLLTSYGANHLLDWRKQFWGSDWPNVGTSWFSNSFMKMSTMNDPPRGIFQELTRLFDIKLYVAYSDSVKGGILIVEKGTFTEETVKDEEAEVIYLLTTDFNYSYERWLGNNKDANRSKKLEMELLFNYDTAIIGKAKEIIKQNIENVKII